jgi:CheY-like chemotaxis protein/anti-sigma regulatory factor (Ser/Thr protein kinase)
MQALSNLVSNAIKFTHSGKVTVKILMILDNLVFSVADTGIGINESYQKLIFERFRQADSGLTRPYEGSGLGLAITKGNIEFLGGKISVESEPDRGSIFTCVVPVEFISESANINHDEKSVDSLKRSKILIAEDDEVTYLYIRELLKDLDIEFTWVMNGAEAVEKIQNDSTFNLVLMDLKMPLMDGYEATGKIKEIRPGIPVIAVSSFTFREDVDKIKGAGFEGHIRKPVERSDLINKIVHALNVKTV